MAERTPSWFADPDDPEPRALARRRDWTDFTMVVAEWTSPEPPPAARRLVVRPLPHRWARARVRRPSAGRARAACTARSASRSRRTVRRHAGTESPRLPRAPIPSPLPEPDPPATGGAHHAHPSPRRTRPRRRPSHGAARRGDASGAGRRSRAEPDPSLRPRARPVAAPARRRSDGARNRALHPPSLTDPPTTAVDDPAEPAPSRPTRSRRPRPDGRPRRPDDGGRRRATRPVPIGPRPGGTGTGLGSGVELAPSAAPPVRLGRRPRRGLRATLR